MKRLIYLLVVVVLIMSSVVTVYLFSPLKAQDNVDIYIPRGSTVYKASSILEQSGIIRYPALFHLLLKVYCRLNSSSMYSGAYRFNSTHNHLQVFRALLSGKQALKVRVTFPEGITSHRFASILRKNVGLDSAFFIQLIHSDSLISSLGVHSPTLEGYLMPNTYEYFWKQPADDIISALVSEQDRIWSERFEQLALSQGKTRNEVLTLASIIEAETPQDSERPRVAGVYTNRLRRGMKLEADPTVQYALGGEAHRVLLSDLEYPSDYNTYLHTGLPPGPINSPSISSIEAALNPEQNRYFFFCAKGDGSNTHSFATSSEEHHINVLRYRKNRRLKN